MTAREDRWPMIRVSDGGSARLTRPMPAPGMVTLAPDQFGPKTPVWRPVVEIQVVLDRAVKNIAIRFGPGVMYVTKQD